MPCDETKELSTYMALVEFVHNAHAVVCTIAVDTIIADRYGSYIRGI